MLALIVEFLPLDIEPLSAPDANLTSPSPTSGTSPITVIPPRYASSIPMPKVRSGADVALISNSKVLPSIESASSH